MDNAQIMEPNIVLIELERFSKKLKKQQQSYSAIRQIESFFEIFLSFCIIKNPKKILDISTDKPDNHFLSLSFEENAMYITGDKLALEFAKTNNIKAAFPTDFIKGIKWLIANLLLPTFSVIAR